MVWKPGQWTPVHDHGTWGVVGVYQGTFEERGYLRCDLEQEKREGVELQRGGIVMIPTGGVSTFVPNPDHIHHMDKAKFAGGTDVEVGTIMAFSGPDGMEIPGIITDIAGDSVTVDFNHPLAGQDVTFDVNILAVE